MSKVEELERVIELLPPEDFEQLSAWMARRQNEKVNAPAAFRDHSAFLNSCAPEDEGLYNDA
jgi:hypothetical protein